MSGNRLLPRPRPQTTHAAIRQTKQPKTAKQMERHIKGIANHRRIDILLLVGEREGISVEGIAETLQANFKTIAEHIRRLMLAGLLTKKYEGRNVVHSLTPYGQFFFSIIRTFQHS